MSPNVLAETAMKASIAAAHLRGLYCYCCGRSTANQSTACEPDGHVRHIRCGGELVNLATENSAARLLREGRY